MENNNYLKEILKTYENHRLFALDELEKRKQLLYKRSPKLQEIEDKLNTLGITTAKCILLDNNSDHLNNLKNEQEKLKQEKQKILKSLNIDESFFVPNYNCKLCNDTGYITKNYEKVMCSCLKQKLLDVEYNKSNTFNLDKDNFDKFNIDLYSDEINKEKYNSNISPKENINIIKNISKRFIEEFDNPNSKNLLFTGNTGLGKTFISNCIANEILKLRKNRTLPNSTSNARFHY